VIVGKTSSGGVNRWSIQKASSLLVSGQKRPNFVLQCRVARALLS
jgi:hypothetical protein